MASKRSQTWVHLRSNHFQKSNFIKLINDDFSPAFFFFLKRDLWTARSRSWSSESEARTEDFSLTTERDPWISDSLFAFKTFVKSISINSYFFIFSVPIFNDLFVRSSGTILRFLFNVRSLFSTKKWYGFDIDIYYCNFWRMAEKILSRNIWQVKYKYK